MLFLTPSGSSRFRHASSGGTHPQPHDARERPETEKSRSASSEYRPAASRCTAAACGILILAGAVGCRLLSREDIRLEIYRGPPPSQAERYCAWFGDRRGPILYFGTAPFWWALRSSGGDPRADLRIPGPQPVGRFDLERRTFLPPLEVAGPLSNDGGVWDVLAHPNGRIYFTTYFGPAGSVDPASGTVERFPDPGTGLNELGLGPDDSILASRYSTPDGLPGAVVQLDQEGRLLAEHVLEPMAGYRTAAKSLAWDPAREEIWVNTDLLPESGGGAIGHDARVLGADGRERLRVADPELQFMTFGPDGTGYFAERHGRRLRLRIRGPELDDDPLLPARIVALDDAFPEVDFVQDIRVGDDGSDLVMRWSGRLHRVHANGRLQDLSLPRLVPDGLYYTAVQHAGRVCATYCADVSVVCRPLR